MSETETSAVEPLAPVAPKFIAGKARSETVKLEWPIEYDGKTYDTITITRPTTADLEAWRDKIAAMKAAEEDVSKERLPMFDAPTAVLEALDPDDDDSISAVVTRFLPRRFRDDAT
ncbi:MAG: phage tail assembly protein [Chelatococcus sp.]|nr:MAG: phage tail assembly protein [Chelatococcus sp.]